MKKLLGALGLWTLAASAQAMPLTECPSEAFLVQGKPAQLYGVDLSSGSYRTLASSMGTSNSLNALSFNFHDQYIYGWDRQLSTVVRIGSDFQRQPLDLRKEMKVSFYVGDISTVENTYYIYLKGRDEIHGLWAIDLDPTSANYLNPERIINGIDTYLNIYDFAFSPIDDMLYAVDDKGILVTIDPDSGGYKQLGEVGEKGTFGAVYFDVDGNFYISRNKDGRIFKIDILSGDYEAIPYAQGPSSATNDGARCAFAPVIPIDSVKLDFGDAPDSYGSSMAQNGARHNVEDSKLRLGKLVDGEAQAFFAPDSDEGVNEADEDGVRFITSMSAGNQAIVSVEVQGRGNLNAWVDFDLDGEFDSTDQIFDDKPLSEGTHNLVFEVPIYAAEGTSWSRFRFSSSSDVEPTGGVADGEVEDYAVPIEQPMVTRQYYPSSGAFVTLAFEDLWPSRGDYDMNDFVLHYRTGYSTIGTKVTGVSISGEVLAIGAAYHNGFGVMLEGLKREFIDEGTIEYEINGMTQGVSPLEVGQSKAVFIVAKDLWQYIEPAEGCNFYRTETNCGNSPVQFDFRIDAQLSTPVEESSLELGLYNPFLFATDGYYRNSIFTSPPGRSLEIHLKNQEPTEFADTAWLGMVDDRSDPWGGYYYLNENGLPWALEFGTQWKHPNEYVDLIEAYPKFVNFIQSQGTQDQDWYLLHNAVLEKLYQE